MPRPSHINLTSAALAQAEYAQLYARAIKHRLQASIDLTLDAIPDLTDDERVQAQRLYNALDPSRSIADTAQRIVDAIVLRRRLAGGDDNA